MMDTCAPNFARIPGVVKDLSFNSNLDAAVKLGPTANGIFSAAYCSAIKCPSVQCSKVILTSYSFAIRIAVNISSAVCACAFKGISFLITGINPSIFGSKAGLLKISSPAASFLAK